MNNHIVNNIRNAILVEIQDLEPADQKEVISSLLEDFIELERHL